MYATHNFKTKTALKVAVASGIEVGIFQPGPFGGNEPASGKVAVCGPWSPEPHKWYATVTLEDGRIVKVV